MLRKWLPQGTFWTARLVGQFPQGTVFNVASGNFELNRPDFGTGHRVQQCG
jgi:hypothetical protein